MTGQRSYHSSHHRLRVFLWKARGQAKDLTIPAITDCEYSFGRRDDRPKILPFPPSQTASIPLEGEMTGQRSYHSSHHRLRVFLWKAREQAKDLTIPAITDCEYSFGSREDRPKILPFQPSQTASIPLEGEMTGQRSYHSSHHRLRVFLWKARGQAKDLTIPAITDCEYSFGRRYDRPKILPFQPSQTASIPLEGERTGQRSYHSRHHRLRVFLWKAR